MGLTVQVVGTLKQFDRLHKKFFKDDFVQPTVKNVPAARAVTTSDGRVLAAGFVKLHVEAIISTDQEIDKTVRAHSIKLLMDELVAWCKERGIEQVHVYTSSEQFSRFLAKRYNFEEAKVKPLVLNISEGNNG